jgi:hypothetical protein
VIDSADGQLARLTGQVSEFGRVLDGISGYVTHVAAYVAIMLGLLSQGGSPAIVVLAILAGVVTALQAQMYDYHRTVYADVVVRGVVDAPHRRTRRGLVAAYEAVQHRLAGAHRGVESEIARRAADGLVREEDRTRYRQCFQGPVRGWNLLGDNVRRFAIGLLAFAHHLDWFFLLIVGPMNVIVIVLWLRQRRADRRFLALMSDAASAR